MATPTVVNTYSKIDIILTNAYCCISKQAARVSDLLSIGDKCAESEAIKLKLLIDYVETLKCHNFTNTNSIFVLKQTIADYNSTFNFTSISILFYTLIANGIKYSLKGDNSSTVGEIYEQLVSSINNFVDSYTIFDENYAYIYAMFTCDIESLSAGIDNQSGVPISSIAYTKTQQGNCTIENCISEENINKIINKILTTCDICECQLIQE